MFCEFFGELFSASLGGFSSGSTTSLFYRDLGARWQHDDSRWRGRRASSKENGERPTICTVSAPVNNYPFWKGLGECSVARATLARSGGGPAVARLCFVKYSCVETKPIILP
jgi:hypothetical protein